MVEVLYMDGTVEQFERVFVLMRADPKRDVLVAQRKPGARLKWLDKAHVKKVNVEVERMPDPWRPKFWPRAS